VFAANDLSAIGVLKAVAEVGLLVPGDISVVGFDDLSMSSFTIPALTTIRQPAREIAERGTRILFDMIEGKRVRRRRILIEPELVVRESTARPRARPRA